MASLIKKVAIKIAKLVNITVTKIIQIARSKYKSGNTIYEIFIYEIILDGEVEQGKNQEIEIALKKQNKEIALISTEEKILCEKPKDNLLCVATNQKK